MLGLVAVLTALMAVMGGLSLAGQFGAAEYQHTERFPVACFQDLALSDRRAGMTPTISPEKFAEHWKASTLNERQGSQSTSSSFANCSMCQNRQVHL